jgi:Na+-transporting methylmalonyl-CoA/oxaloacetate decarboxylase gamma subunit
MYFLIFSGSLALLVFAFWALGKAIEHYEKQKTETKDALNGPESTHS